MGETRAEYKARITVDARKIRAAHNALVSAIEHLSGSRLTRVSGDSLLLDDLNNYRRRLVRTATSLGVAVE